MDKPLKLKLDTVEDRPRSVRIALAVLPPLALYIALLLVVRDLFGMPSDALSLLAGAAPVLVCAVLPKRISPLLSLAAALLALLALCFLPTARAGAAAFVNRLYAHSEAVNAYAYVYLKQAAEDAASLRTASLFIGLFCGAVCASAGRYRIAAAALFLAAALLEGYFGITPPLWKNLVLFAFLAFALLSGNAGVGNRTALLAALAAIAALVFALAPRPNMAVEASSEYLRDELGRAAMQVRQEMPPPIEESNPVHRESRLHEEASNEDPALSQNQREYEKQTKNEQEISIPHRTNWLRIILLMLAVIAILVIPFLPFLLLRRARQLAEKRRAEFADSDNAFAVQAMFRHTVDWLCACGLDRKNRPFSSCSAETEALISKEYAVRYAQAAEIFEEAAYSDHAIDDAQRQTVQDLMKETEQTLYASSDRKTRLRLKYVACLCEE